jgi:hypothetical protein
VFHWDDRQHSAFDDIPLRLFSIAGTESFSYCITDEHNRPCAVKGFLADSRYHFFDKPVDYLGDLIAEDPLLCAGFKDVYIAVRGVPFVVLEEAGVATDMAAGRLKGVTDLGHADRLFIDQAGGGLAIAYALPEMFLIEAQNWYSNVAVRHIMTSLVTTELEQSAYTDRKVVRVNITTDLAEIVCTRNGSLLFVNHYRVGGPEDTLYYVLAVLRQLDIAVDQAHVYCSGTATGITLPVLGRFLPHCTAETGGKGQVAGFPVIETWDLITMLRCAS